MPLGLTLEKKRIDRTLFSENSKKILLQTWRVQCPGYVARFCGKVLPSQRLDRVL